MDTVEFDFYHAYKTQKEVANVVEVTEVTIRNRYRELKKKLNIEVVA